LALEIITTNPAQIKTPAILVFPILLLGGTELDVVALF
jgi:hypothetical protein